ncbi:FHA domain-containing protein [Aquiluna borgnonia]|uniref:FHA domain-containing protein n=1 Tax=Aquiluna borgnonia TaxID=2499157 RepID=A0A7D4PQS3_9MICO|nr:FHA domain-containing protein [Aquiluna borgnonia]QKJ25406.1 FHA domain-containing protein [Aquiluna borgnonia]
MAREQFDSEDTARFSEDLVPASIDSLSFEESNAISALPSGSALLIVRKGAGLGSRFLLDQDITVAGRHPNADIFLDDVTVSRKHAEFIRSGTSFKVVDLGSMNGSYVAGKRVDDSPLQHGDEVLIGKFHMTFFASEKDR